MSLILAFFIIQRFYMNFIWNTQAEFFFPEKSLRRFLLVSALNTILLLKFWIIFLVPWYFLQTSRYCFTHLEKQEKKPKQTYKTKLKQNNQTKPKKLKKPTKPNPKTKQKNKCGIRTNWEAEFYCYYVAFCRNLLKRFTFCNITQCALSAIILKC